MKTNGKLTEPAASAARLWRFGECEFDELRFELRVRGGPVELERKPLEVLQHLLSRGGEVVRKEELLDAVWPGVTVVDASLATAVSKLRKALDGQDVIQTVPRVGYRIHVPLLSTSSAEILQREPVSTAAAPSEPVLERPGHLGPAVKPTRRRLFRWTLAAALLVLLSSGFFAYRRQSRPPSASPAIAILPFQNVSSNHDLDYLRAALPDEVANTLGAARSLTIRPLAAAARFSGPAIDFREAARILDVNKIVTGHYLIAGNQLQITMEAVDPTANRVVWRDTVNVPSRNLLELQEQIAGMTRWKLSRALGIKEFVPETAPRASNGEAYELYLKNIPLEMGDKGPNQQGIELLRRAVQLDPNYAPAWGMLSLRYYSAARFGGGGQEMMAFADAAAEKELALDPDSPNPVAELTIHRTERGELVKAHQTALELLRRRPDNANNHHVLSYVLRYGGSLQESARECDLAMLLATQFVWGACSTTFMELGDYKRARSLLRADLSSEFSKAHAIDVYLRAGNLAEALKIPAPRIPGYESYQMVLACARQAPAAEVQALAAKVEPDDDPEVDYFFAGHLAYCGQTKAAFRMLKLAIDRNYCSFPAMDKDPLFDKLRDDPEFKRIRVAGIICHQYFIANRERKPAVSRQTLSSSLQ